jgi:hypothetical protein
MVLQKMAMSQISSEFVHKVQIEGVQTVVPSKVTDPRETCLVSVEDPVSSDIFRGCLSIVLCYNKAVEEDSGWLVAGWIKESLGRALQDQPMLSGRLRRVEDGNGELEMVSNDTGVRLVEAKITMTLQEFLGLEEREKAEADLVFWMDIDEQNPQFSPVLYVQVRGCLFAQKVNFLKLLFKLSCVCLSLKKLVNGKYFSVKEKFNLISMKVFSFYFGRKTLFRSCRKFRNIILFADYIKFGSQTFD